MYESSSLLVRTVKPALFNLPDTAASSAASVSPHDDACAPRPSMTTRRRVSPLSSASGCWLNGSGGAPVEGAPAAAGGGTAGTPAAVVDPALDEASGVGKGASGPIRS